MNENNENKLVPRLRFPEFRNEEGWEMKKVGEVIEESKVPSTSNNPHNRITVRLNQKGVEKREVRGTEADNATYFFIRRKGQFIYGKQNLHKGAFGLIPDELDGFESSQDIPAFDFKNGYYPQYFVYYLGQENVYPDLEKISTGTGSKRIHPRDLFQVKFPFPKTEEQQKIAACLSSLDDVITAESKKLEVLKEHKKGLLQNLFPQEGETVPKLRFKEFEDSGEWVEYPINSIGEVVTGGTPSKEENEYWGGDFVWVTAQDFKGKYITDSVLKLTQKGKEKSRIIPKNSVLVTCIASIGLNGINKVECATNQQINSVVCNSENHYEFVYYSITKNGNRLKNLAGQTAVPIINKSVFEKFIIHKPKSYQEQQKIAACLSSIDDLINAQSQKIETLKLHKKGLLQGLFPDVNEHNG